MAHAFIAALTDAHAETPGDAAAFDPQRKALAYRIWAHCEAVGWDCSMRDLADEFGVTVHRIRSALFLHDKWFQRLRVTREGYTGQQGYGQQRESFMPQTRLHDLEFAPRAGWVEE